MRTALSNQTPLAIRPDQAPFMSSATVIPLLIESESEPALAGGRAATPAFFA